MGEPESHASQPALELRSVTRRYGDVAAVDRVSFGVRPGEFFSLLGPSGCGKTTTLRLIAGFERPDEGTILLQGRRSDRARPYERPVGMVFQSYALFPHLTVGENVAFGLKRRKVRRDEAASRVREALERVRLPGLQARDPGELSGGQRQRVALARALVLDPPILLLDEPLGALDLKLRKEMQLELKFLQRDLGTTFVYVTHDQEEALTMSDRIGVMGRGRIEQIGTAAEIYERPRSRFVAEFIGSTNFVEGRVVERAGDRVTLESADWGRVQVQLDGRGAAPHAAGTPMEIAIRPERLRLLPEGASHPGMNRAAGIVRDRIYLGDHLRYPIELTSGREVLVVASRSGTDRADGWNRGDRVTVGWHPEDGILLAGA